MKLLTIACLLFSFSLSNAQSDSLLSKAGWRISKKRTMGNHEILKVHGFDVYGYTNILFMSCKDLINEVKQRAAREMWTDEKLKETLRTYDSSKFYGRIVLSIGRATVSAANARWFTIVVEDSTGRQLLKKKLNESVPKAPRSAGRTWSNIQIIDLIDSPVTLPFEVIVTDEFRKRNPKTAFRILN